MAICKAVKDSVVDRTLFDISVHPVAFGRRKEKKVNIEWPGLC